MNQSTPTGECLGLERRKRSAVPHSIIDPQQEIQQRQHAQGFVHMVGVVARYEVRHAWFAWMEEHEIEASAKS